MKIGYLDEAGISNLKHDPYMVIAGIIVDADHQWFAARDQLDEIASEYLDLEEGSKAPIFHAKDLFHGTGPFDRKKYSRELRLKIIHEIISIPRKLRIPVVYASQPRKPILDGFAAKGYSLKSGDDATFSICYASCLANIEAYALEKTTDSETAMVVVEHNERFRSITKFLHDDFLSSDSAPDFFISQLESVFPLKKVIDTTHFCGKNQAPLLQIADSLAFCIRRCAARNSYFSEFIPLLCGESSSLLFGVEDFLASGIMFNTHS